MRERIYVGPGVLSDKDALDIIEDVLDGQEWQASDLDVVANVVRATGRTIGDIDEEGSA